MGSAPLETPLRVIEDQRPLVDPKPCKRKLLRSGSGASKLLEVITALIGEEAGDMEAVCKCFFHLKKHLRDLVQCIRGDDADRIQEEITMFIQWVKTRCLQEYRAIAFGNNRMRVFR